MNGDSEVLRSAHELIGSCYRITKMVGGLVVFPGIWNNAGNGPRINFRGKTIYPTRRHSIVDSRRFGARFEAIPLPFLARRFPGQ